METLKEIQNCQGYDDSQQLNLYHNDLYWLVGERNQKDNFDEFDDTLYLFKGRNLIKSYIITTNAGKYGLKNYNTYNKYGCAVLQSNRIVYDCYTPGLHRKSIFCLRQQKIFPYFRDFNKNEKAEEIGKLYTHRIIFANMHSSTKHLPPNKKKESWMGPKVQETNIEIVREYIGKWSLACQVFQSNVEYWKFMELVYHSQQKSWTYAII